MHVYTYIDQILVQCMDSTDYLQYSKTTNIASIYANTNINQTKLHVQHKKDFKKLFDFA